MLPLPPVTYYDVCEPLRWWWTIVVFIIGTCIGSFLNVVIWRLPRGESIVTGASHCPKCNTGIPPYLNVPIFAWLVLRGRCAHCRAPISPRYLFVEALTGVLFVLVWERAWELHGMHRDLPAIILGVYLFLVALIIAMSFIDIDLFIIPDELNGFGFALALVLALALPGSHDFSAAPYTLDGIQHKSILFQGLVRMLVDYFPSVLASARLMSLFDLLLGVVFGAGILWLLAEVGKLVWGHRRIRAAAPVRLTVDAQGLHHPEDGLTPWDDLLLRESDTLSIRGRLCELQWEDDPSAPPPAPSLPAGGELEVQITEYYVRFERDSVARKRLKKLVMESQDWTQPREAMGMGDVKLMAVLGAFLGPGAAIFILCLSSFLGAIGGILPILFARGKWYSPLPYGPYIGLAALLYLLRGDELVRLYARLMYRLFVLIGWT